MITDIDIWRCAHLTMDNYDEDASAEGAVTGDDPADVVMPALVG